MMMPLIEFYKTTPEDIFGTSDSKLNCLVYQLNYHYFPIKYYDRINQIIQFRCADGSENKEDKEELVKVEDKSIHISDSSGDGYIVMVDLMSISVKGETK